MYIRWVSRGAGLAVGLMLVGAVGCQSGASSKDATAAGPCAAISDEPVATPVRSHQDFGQPMQGDPGTAVDADAILAAVDQHDGQQVRIRGQVQKVCQKRGCWLTLAGPEQQTSILVKFTCPIDGRLIPADAAGQEVIVEGVLRKVQISEAMAWHLAEDSGASEQEIALIQGPQPLVRIASPSARLIEMAVDAEAQP